MKKSIFSLGLLCGAAVSVFALASCSGPTTVKDLEGNDYTVEATDDSEKVAKSMVLAAKAISESETKHYAAGFDAKLEANAKVPYQGVDVDVNAKTSVSVKGTIGTAAYTQALEITNGKMAKATDEQNAKANKELAANLRFEATASLDATIKATTESEEDAVKSMADSLNNTAANINLAAYSAAATDETPFTLYIEGSGKASTSIWNLASMFAADYVEATETEDKKEVNLSAAYKYEVPTFYNAAEATTELSYYQNHTIKELIQTFSKPSLQEALTGETKELFDKDFFDSAEYKSFKEYIDKLGVKITEAKGGSVTFEVNGTGEALTAVAVFAASKETDPTKAAAKIAEANKAYEKDKKYFTLTFTLDVARGFVSNAKLDLSDLGAIANLANQAMVKGTTGSIKLEINAYVDGDVKFEKTPDANKTYANLQELFAND